MAERAVRSPGNRAIALDGQSRVGNWYYYLHLAEGGVVLAHGCKLDLEGIVPKRAGSLYRSGASRNWLKCRKPEFARRS